MRRRSILATVGSGIGVSLAGCLGGGENTDTNDSTGSGNGSATVSVRLDGAGAVDQFDQLELGLGKVELTPEDGEPTSFSVLETYDIADGAVTVVDSKSLPAGSYTDLSMTATVDRRELSDGGSPQVVLDDEDLTTSLGDGSLELSGGTTELTVTMEVTKPEDDKYRMVLAAASKEN